MTNEQPDVPKDGGDERISTKALREHASKGWDDNCLLPKGSVKRIADELDALRAALAQKAVPIAVEPIPMLLFCPRCGTQHVDKKEWSDDPHDIEQGQMRTWNNPPHWSNHD